MILQTDKQRRDIRWLIDDKAKRKKKEKKNEKIKEEIKKEILKEPSVKKIPLT